LTPPNRRDNARSDTLLGDDALRAADALLSLALWNDAVSRAYYAAFHYARALLVSEGLEARSHRGVFALLEEHFERTSRLPKSALSAFARLQTFRGLADYDATERLLEERAREEVASAHSFVDESRKLLRSIGFLDA
jgi:uncharacterized protein